jgi:SAM-dependent methyltransferase
MHATGARCRICDAALEHSFVDLGLSPLCQTVIGPAERNAAEPFYPLHVWVCGGCFLVQLEEYVTPGEIFSEYAYFSSYSDSWLRHAEAYVEMATARLGLGPESLVVEVASNDGYLLQYFVKRGVPVLGIEPAANVAEVARRKGVPTEVRFFGEETARALVAAGRRADLILGNNVLAHVPDIRSFVRGLRILLRPGGTVTLEFPHLLRLMRENQFDTIYHEHFSYLSLLALEPLFASERLAVFDVEELPTHGGSLRLFVRHAEDPRPAGPRVGELLAREREAGLARLETYAAFAEQVRETKRGLLEFLIGAKRAGKRVAGYGAPGKGNTLLNYCGIGTDFLDFTVDRNPYKQGKYTPGTRIPILPPEALAERRPDYVLILPWNLKDEIVEQHAYVHDWGGRFVVPIPEVRVLPGDPR